MASKSEDTPKATRTRRTRTAAKKKASPTDVPDTEVVVRPDDAMPPAAGKSLLTRGGIRSSDVTNFLRQLIMLLEAGTPILRSLKTLCNRGQREAARQLVRDITAYVEAGNPLWQAFDRHPRYFDQVFVNLIKASEASGTLITVLRRTVEYREERELLGKRVRGAMIYPILLIVACFGVMILLTNFVVPQFEEMFKKADLEIPPLTVWFLAVSDVVQLWWWVPIVAVFVLIVLYNVWYVRSPVRRLTADYVKLKLPVYGPIAHKYAIVELTRTMSLLLRSGLSMMATLDLTRSAIHNRAVAQSLQKVRDSIESGGGLEEPLRESEHVIPPVVTDMLVTGEESGRVDVVCEQISEVYEEEVKIAVSSIGEAIQPIFTVIVGVVVIILFIALFLPLVTMIDQISGAGL
jgi:type IV pilus assembly protein PilC